MNVHINLILYVTNLIDFNNKKFKGIIYKTITGVIELTNSLITLLPSSKTV